MRESESAIVVASSVEQMRAIGGGIAAALVDVRDGPLVIAFEGELGAGKTTLIGGLLNALGLIGAARSPTYTLIEPYELAGRHIQHLDLYRLGDPSEVEALGLRDTLTRDAVVLIEWPDRGGDFIPQADLHIQIAYLASDVVGRQIQLSAATAAGRELKIGALRANER
jgi:tRNA threonylcarbamoyladenosine biosynthesis protein TsaE